ncbi:MAG: hypothetical protein MJY85_10560 [Fibrobacter sp.]|nr:hypothetical protein [Fibrobacter sp.]
MKKLLFFVLILAVMSFAEVVPVKATRASATLPPQNGIKFSSKNLIDKLSSTAWAAPFQKQPVTLEMKVEAYEVSALHILNGDHLDKRAYEGSSRVKNIKIYVNKKDNLVASATLKNHRWNDTDTYDEIIFSPVLQNVKILIIQIESVYPGEHKNELMMSEVSLEGHVKNPLKDGFTPVFQTLTDARDGQEYKTVKIGSRNWMAENLAYADEGSSCVENKVGVRCSEKGRYYSEFSADDGLCPEGWRLPSKDDFMELNSFIKELALDTANIFSDLFIFPKSSNRFGMGMYALDGLYNSSSMETSFWTQRFKIDGFEEDVPFIRVNATQGAYIPDVQLMTNFRDIDVEQRQEFFVRCVEE